MSDSAAQPWTDAAAAEAAQEPAAKRPPIPLEGDWSDGLAGAAREHGLPLPARIDGPTQAPEAAAQMAGPSRAAEELAAQAAAGVPLEALRTEQASAKAIFALAAQDGGATAIVQVQHAAEPAASLVTESVVAPGIPPIMPRVETVAAAAREELDTAATGASARQAAPEAAAPEAAPAEAASREAAAPGAASREVPGFEAAGPAPEAAPEARGADLDEVAKNIQSALALEERDAAQKRAEDKAAKDRAAEHDSWAAPAATNGASSSEAASGAGAAALAGDAPTPWSDPTAADPWAERTAAAGPEIWAAAAAPAGQSADAGAAPDWGAPSPDGGAGAAWPAPSTDPTLMSAKPLPAASVEDDLPVPVPEPARPPPTIGRPAFLAAEPRVVVHTLAGRVKRGTLREPDLEHPELRLSPQAGGGEERISLTEVKAVFFMLEPGETPPARPGGRVRITLSDGRQLDGFRESDGPRGGVFLVPLDAARTNTRAIFVCGDAIQNIDIA